jgi:hypothetical protein
MATASKYGDSPHLFFSGWRADGTWLQLYQIGFGLSEYLR